MEQVQNITMRQLETFLELSRSGTFGGAAARLGIGQPALSRNLKQLETELGVDLVQRHTRGGVLTQKGVRLSTLASTFFESLQGLTDADTKSDTQGRLTIGIPQSISSLLIPKIFSSALERLPALKVNFFEAPGHELEQAIETGLVDIGLLYDPPKSGTTVNVPLVEEDMMVIASPSWSWPESRSFVTVRELVDLPVVLLNTGHSDRRKLSQAERQQGIQLKPIIEASNSSTIKSLVNSGVGLSVASAFGISREVAAGSLQSWPLGSSRVKTCLSLSAAGKNASSAILADLKQIVMQSVTAYARNDSHIRAVSS